MPVTRHQLTLFVSPPADAALDAVRRALDPVQHGLIAPHVTLCREDEFAATDFPRLAALGASAAPIRLAFGRPQRFAGHGVLLPCIAGQRDFDALRRHLLGVPEPRPHPAHITLAHPRNPPAPGNTPAALHALALDEGLSMRFEEVTLIRQDGDAAWTVVGSFRLVGIAD